MATIRMSGTWEGEYSYGPDYRVAGTSVPFRMSLAESWLWGIRGYVRDDASRGGMPERGRIRGRRRRQELRFVKAYPRHYVVTADGSLLDLREHVEREMSILLPEVLPVHRVFYIGDLAADGLSIEGDWAILPWSVAVGKQLFQVSGGESGTWTARRVSDQRSSV